MKILVFGAGPLGSLMAARLHEAGHDVSILARNQRLEDIRTHGIIIREEGSTKEEKAEVKAVEAFLPEDNYDLVMIVMRKNQADEIIPTLAKNKKVKTFLFMLNNAEGPENWIKALGKERVLLGFPYPGGERDGHIMEVAPVNEKKTWAIPIGEVDGKVRERTREVAEVLGSMRGYKVQVRKDMEAWLKYHTALLMPAFAPAMYAADISMKRFARTRDLQILAVRGIKEALYGLRKKAGIPPSPSFFRIFELIPEPILVKLVEIVMRKELAKSSMEGHPRAARDELKILTDELMTILKKAGAHTPAIDSLQKYYDPETPPYPEGKNTLSLKWGGILIPIGVIILVIIGLISLGGA